MSSEPAQNKALSVSQAASLAQKTLESLHVLIEGEVSQVTDKRGYSAVYFTIKDENASIPCKMWMNRYLKTGIRLKVGALVQIYGRFTYYGPNGSFSFDAFTLHLSGEGNLRVKVAQIAERLRLEGLMEPARKRPLPAYPQRIGLVTSPRGAAVRDVLRTLRRRYPLAEVLVCGVPVEGKTAPTLMQEALRAAAEEGSEVILLVRGGGSFEDLMPFNDEVLARAVASSSVPVVTGIGHEPDNSICDMVADFRASTPTAAAEAVAPDHSTTAGLIDGYASRMLGYFTHKLEVTRLHLERIRHRPIFEEPDALLGGYAQAIDMYSERLQRAIPNAIAQDTQILDQLELRMNLAAPAAIVAGTNHVNMLENRLRASIPANLQRDKVKVQGYNDRLSARGMGLLESYEAALGLRASRLNDLSPLTVLSRGYALARDDDGKVVRSVAQVSNGQTLSVAVSDGTIGCKVESTAKTSDEHAITTTME